MPLVLPRRSLNIDFVRDGQASGDNYTTELSKLDGLLTFSRSTTATRFNSAGTLETVAAGQPRFDFDPVTLACKGLLIEEARTNLVLNSATLATQGVTVTAQAYTLSFWGTGSVALSGAFTGNLAGTGASNRVALTFTPAAGTLTLTVTGSVTNAQVEAGAFSTSYIPTTSAAVTRAVDLCHTAQLKPWFSSPFTITAEGISYGANAVFPLWLTLEAAGSGFLYLGKYTDGNGRLQTPGGAIAGSAITLGANTKFAALYNGSAARYSQGGSAVQTLNTAMSTPDTFRFGGYNSGGSNALNGWLKRVSFMPYAASDTLLKALST